MTGQLVYVGAERFGGGHPNDSLIQTLPDRFTRAVIEFTDGTNLYFNDMRKFGWVKLYPSAEVPNIDFMKKVGPEPLEHSFTAEQFIPRVRRRNNTCIKAAILDQTVLAGVGNIYADESLFESGIRPDRQPHTLNQDEIQKLHKAIIRILKKAVKVGGSSVATYRLLDDSRGNYAREHKVYGKDGQKCSVCKTPLKKIIVGGRTTIFCPKCQR